MESFSFPQFEKLHNSWSRRVHVKLFTFPLLRRSCTIVTRVVTSIVRRVRSLTARRAARADDIMVREINALSSCRSKDDQGTSSSSFLDRSLFQRCSRFVLSARRPIVASLARTARLDRFTRRITRHGNNGLRCPQAVTTDRVKIHVKVARLRTDRRARQGRADVEAKQDRRGESTGSPEPDRMPAVQHQVRIRLSELFRDVRPPLSPRSHLRVYSCKIMPDVLATTPFDATSGQANFG